MKECDASMKKFIAYPLSSEQKPSNSLGQARIFQFFAASFHQCSLQQIITVRGPPKVKKKLEVSDQFDQPWKIIPINVFS